MANLSKKDQQILERCKSEKPWGISVCIDLKDCNVKTIRSAKRVKDYVHKLCDLIKVTRYGRCQVVDFGEDPRVTGLSMTQLIETSLISGHFGNEYNGKFAYLDIFSCQPFPPYQVANFAKKFFEAKRMKVKINFRY